MNKVDIKSDFHKLIDNISDESLLLKFYKIMLLQNDTMNGDLWLELDPEEKEELKTIEKESHDHTNLISHFQMQKKHQRWL